jgi:hypothetical protein
VRGAVTVRLVAALALPAAAALGALQAAPARADEGAPATRPAYRELRFEEDWSALARPEALPSRDFFDPIKYVPLSEDGSVRLSLGGQLRGRLEAWSGYDFGAPRDDDEVFLLSRVMAHADLRVGDSLRFFLELKGAYSTQTGVFDGVRALDTDTFDVQNGFVDLRLGVATKADLTLRVGRQELRFGRQRLVSPLDWANARRTFDGASLALDAAGWRITGFAVRPVRVRAYRWNDAVPGRAFYGVHASGPLAETPARLDLYAYGLHRSDVAIEGTSGDERRATLGGRLTSAIPGTRLDFDLEGAWQGGRVGSERISAWMVAGQLGWWLAEHRLSPRVFVGLDAASGDRHPGGDVQLFDPLFPLGHAYLGFADVVGRQNTVAPSLGVSFRPFAAVTAEITGHQFWRAERRSGLFDAAGRRLRAGGLSSARDVGAEIDALVRWQLDPHTVVAVGYSHVFPGRFIRRSGPSESIDFGYVIVQYTF